MPELNQKEKRRKNPYCTKCPHNGKVRGSFKGSPCSKCAPPADTNNHGMTHVSLDLVAGFMEPAGGLSHEGEEGHTPDAFLHDPGTPGEALQVDDDTFAELPAEVCHALRTFFGEWLRMPPTMREAVAMRIADPEVEYHVIAKKLGVTMQAVAMSLKNAAGSQCRALACLTLTKNKPRHLRGNINTTAFRALVMNIASEHCPIRKTELVHLVTKATGSESQSVVMIGRLVNEGCLVKSLDPSVSGAMRPEIISIPDNMPNAGNQVAPPNAAA